MSRARAIWLLAALSTAGALAVDAQPTGRATADLLWVGALGFVVPMLAANARRGPALWSAVVVLLASFGSLGPAVFAVAATLLAMVAHADGRDRFRLAAIGAFAVQAALRLPDPAPAPLLSAAFGAIAITPLVVSGANGLRSNRRRIVRRSAFVATSLTLMLCLAYGVSALQARTSVASAVAATDRAATAVTSGDPTTARDALGVAEQEMRAASRRLSPRWAQPLRALPIVGPNVSTTGMLADQGSLLLSDAVTVVRDVAEAETSAASTSVDLEALTALRTSLDDLNMTLGQTNTALSGSSSPWLAPPLADATERVHGETLRVEELVGTADRVVQVLPEALGISGPTHYFVIMATPAETRFFGGFMGAWAVLRVEDGHVEITKAGSNSEFDDHAGTKDRSLDGEPEFLARYGARYSPERFPKNVTASPDFPTVARVTRELAPQLGIKDSLAGVIYLDPHAIEAFVRLIGHPITVPGLATSIDGTTTADFLLREQYLLFDGSESEARKNMLQEVLSATVLEMFEAELPSPSALRRALAPVVEAGHLTLHLFDPEMQTLIDEAGWGGAFPDRDGGDLLSLRTANANANKIDTLLERAVHYDVVLGDHTVDAVASITLTSTAPGSGLPSSVIGNINGDPPGDNRLYLSFYSPWRLSAALIDGEALPMEEARELGVWSYSAPVVVPAGEQRTVRLTLSGTRVASAPYQLTIAEQVLAVRDDVTVTVSNGDRITLVAALPDERPTVTRLRAPLRSLD